MREQHAFRTVLGDDHIGFDLPGLVLRVWRCALGYAHHAGVVGELFSPAGQARPNVHIEAVNPAVLDRQHIVFRGFLPEEVLQFLELGWILGGKVVGFGEVLVDVVELPLIVEDRRQSTLGLGSRVPWSNPRRRRRYPSVVVDAPVAKHLEILRGVLRRRLRIIKRIKQARAFDGLLRYAVDARRRG